MSTSTISEDYPLEPSERVSFTKALENLINSYSQENWSDTPDYILAEYLIGCLQVYEKTVKARDKWFGFAPFSQLE